VARHRLDTDPDPDPHFHFDVVSEPDPYWYHNVGDPYVDPTPSFFLTALPLYNVLAFSSVLKASKVSNFQYFGQYIETFWERV
jgi:hypothetical protein